MSKFSDINEALDSIIGDIDLQTPESLAWKLLTDETIDQASLLAFNEENSGDDDPASFLFEILINIYMEMIINGAKMNHIINKHEKGKELTIDDFALDLKNIEPDALTEPYRNLLTKIGFFLTVHTNPDDIDNYYCRILLRDSTKDAGYFFANANKIDKDKKFHFVLNASYHKQTNVKDIYAICNIGKNIYTISFEKMISNNNQ